MNEQALAIQETPIAVAPSVTPASLLQVALQKGADMPTLERLIALQERMEANDARKAYVVAMSAFKTIPQTIAKNKLVSFTTAKGETHYMHATLDHICEVIGPSMAKNGLSHRWVVDQAEGGMIRVTCMVTHVLGHTESVTLVAGADQSGNKNNIQAVGSTVTYLQRYTLLSALGLATGGEDDDGAGSEPIQTITTEQVADIRKQIAELTIDEAGAKLYEEKLCKTFKVGSLEEVRADQHRQITVILNNRRQKIAEERAKKE